MFIRQAANDIIDRLRMIDKNFHDILEVSAKCGYLTKLLSNEYTTDTSKVGSQISGEPPQRILIREDRRIPKFDVPNLEVSKVVTATDMSPLLLDSFKHDHKLLIDEEHLEFPENSFDLIVYSLGLHWINDVQNFLFNIKRFLKPDGIFIGNFVGGDSLKNLRKLLIELEIASGFKHSPHISPFIHFDHVPTLLSQTGFLEVIVDYENIELKFDNPLMLMREIKNIGESNSLVHRHNYAISKKMFSLLQNYEDGFEDSITLINFIASPSKNSIRLKLL